MTALIGWLTILGVGGIFTLWYFIAENIKLRMRLKQFEDVHREARAVCGHDWCDQPEESPTHGMTHTKLEEGQHMYVPALLILNMMPPIQMAGRDKGILIDWKITDRKDK